MARITAGVKRALERETPIASVTHQTADPRSTPPANVAGLARPAPPPRSRVAASAPKETMVAGLVIVSPKVERYAQARPAPEGAGASAGHSVRSNRILSPSPINTAPPISAKGLRPPATAPITTTKPNAAIAAYRPSAMATPMPETKPYRRPRRRVRLKQRKKIGPGVAAIANPSAKPRSSRLDTAVSHRRNCRH